MRRIYETRGVIASWQYFLTAGAKINEGACCVYKTAQFCIQPHSGASKPDALIFQ